MRIMNCPIPEPDKDGIFELALPIGTEIKSVNFCPVEQRIMPGSMVDPRGNAAQMAKQMAQQMALAPMFTIFVDEGSTAKTKRRFQVVGSGGEVPKHGTYIGQASIPPHVTVYIFELPLIST